MTPPRQVLPGSDYMLTRRCSERRFFLRPDPETNNLAEEWPGVSSFHAALSTGNRTAPPPAFFFRPDGGQPESVSFPICRPRGFANQTTDEWRVLVSEQVREAEAEHRERQKPFDSPQSTEPHFDICPRIAAKSKWSRIEAIQRSQAFVERHKAAIKSWMAGIADVLFPYGTYWMRKFAHVLCDAAEAAQEALAPPADDASLA